MSQNIPNIPIYNRNQYNQQQQNPNFAAGNNISNGAAIENNPLLKTAEKAKDNSTAIALGGVAATGGLLAASEYLNRGLQGDYNKSFLGIIENKLNNIENTNKYVSKATGYLKKGIKAIDKFTDKFEFFKTLKYKPSLGGPQVQSQAAGAMGQLSSRAVETLKKYAEAAKNDSTLLSRTQLSNLNNFIATVEKTPHLHTKDIINFINNSGLKLDKTFVKPTKWSLGLLKNKNNLQEIVNKYKLINNYKTSSKLGSRVAGYMFRGAEALTNGLLSGKGSVLMQGIWIAMSLSEGMKAEKGEKFQTFAASLADLMAMTAAVGLQMRVMNHAAGMKFIGMSQANYKKYQSVMQKINEAAKAGDSATYNALKAQIKNLKNYKVKWYQKPIKWLGNILSFGRLRETIKPLKTGTAGGFFKNIPYGLKVGLGYVGRAAIVMGIIIPIFQKLARGFSHTIFGKPIKTIERDKLKEQEAEKEAETAQNEAINKQTQINQEQSLQNPAQIHQQTPQAKPGNLVEKMNNLHNNSAQTPIGAQSITPEQPIASGELKSPDSKIKRTYMPNPILGQEAPINPASNRAAEIDRIWRQADLAEAQAHKLGV